MRSGLPRSLVEGACSTEATRTVDLNLTTAPSTTLLTQGCSPFPALRGRIS
jgi:hypothetical protein